MTTAVEVVRDDDLRERAQRLHRTLGSSLAELAKALYAIQETRVYEQWGYKHFAEYVLDDLEMSPKTAYQCTEVYRAYVEAWDRARNIPFNRLLEAAPLVKQGKRRAAQLVLELVDPRATVRQIRAWKDRELRDHLPESSMPKAADPNVPPRDGPEAWLSLHPDMVLRDRRRVNGVEWAEVAFSLPAPVLTLLLEACYLARRLSGIVRPDGDDRTTIHRELEAICQEVVGEWRAQVAQEDER